MTYYAVLAIVGTTCLVVGFAIGVVVIMRMFTYGRNRL